MELNEFYSYNNPLFKPLREPARKVSAAFLNVNRVGDTVKEAARRSFKMPFTAAYIHIQLAHKALGYLDEFATILHTANLEQAYPTTPELEGSIDDMDTAFELIESALNAVKQALYEFVKVTDNADHKAMSVSAEDLLAKVSMDYVKLLQIWNTWDEQSSRTSFDSWVREYAKVTEEIE